MNLKTYSRRVAHEVNVGGVKIGSSHPIQIQSMTNTPTADTPSSVEQVKRIAEQIIRPTGLVDPKIIVKETTGQIEDLIQNKIGYRFNNINLLYQAFTRRSFTTNSLILSTFANNLPNPPRK